MSRKPQLNRHEWLLLSAYLDGELSEREKRQVEEKLQKDPASRTALEGLRRTRQVLRYTPQRPVPHNFTLTEDMLRKPLLPSFSRIFSYSAALAGILLVLVLGIDLFSGVGRPQMAMSAAEPVMESFKAAEDQAAEPQQAPQIIYWGNSGPLLGAYGKGGGGDSSGMAYGIGGGAAEVPLTEVAPLPDAAPLTELAPEEDIPQNSITPEEAAPAEESLPVQPEVAQEALPESAEPENMTGAAPENLTNATENNPILGIRPADQQGSIEPQTNVQARELPLAQSQLPYKKIEAVLVLLAVIMVLAAVLSRKLSA